MIKLTLTIDGKRREFVTREIPTRACLEALKLTKAYEADSGEYADELIEAQLDFVVRLFGGQFSRDEFLDASTDDNYFALMPLLIREAMTHVNSKLAEFPRTAATEPAAI